MRPVVDLRPYLRSDRPYDLVVGNTVLSLPALSVLAKSGLKTVSWVHEMSVLTDEFFYRRQFGRMIRQMDLVIAASYAVKLDLYRHGQDFPVEVVYEPHPNSELLDASDFRTELGIPEDSFVVGGCGTVSWRKGTDIFLKAARLLKSKYDDVYFIWVGAEQLRRDSRLAREMRSVGSSEYYDHIIFTGELQSVQPFFAAIDVFCLTSREDPFPLVCLSAADHGKPIVCFADAGGIPEFVGTDAGKVLPLGDVQRLVAAIEEYYLNRESAAHDGMEGRKKRLGEFSMEASCSRMFEILKHI